MSVFKLLCLSLLVGIFLNCNISSAQENMSADELYKKAEQYEDQKDYKNAMQWYLKAADKDNAGAMYKIGNLSAKGDEYQKAMQWWLKAADKGHTHAMVTIATYYYASTEYPEAMQWYLKAANKGDASAMRSIGVFYEKGLGVKQDKAQAELWFKKAEEAQNK